MRGIGVAQRANLLAKGDAEALLLVDHGERKVVRAHVVLEQRMRADEHVEAARSKTGKQLSPLGFRGRPGEHRMGDSRSVKELPQAALVLLRKDLGRREKQRLTARIGRSRDGERGHNGLARAHIAQEHAVHRMRLRHLAEDVESGLLLLVGERERDRRVERLHARARDLVRRGHMAAAASRPLLHEVELKQEHFLVRQTATRLMGFGQAFGKVNRAKRDLAAHQAILHAKLQRHRVENAFGELERVAHEAPHQRRRHLLASRVHGNDEAVHGRVGPFERKDLRVHHSLEAIVELDFAGNRHVHAGGELLGEPRLAKRGHDHDASRIGDADLHQSQARLRALELDIVDHALDGA